MTSTVVCRTGRSSKRNFSRELRYTVIALWFFGITSTASNDKNDWFIHKHHTLTVSCSVINITCTIVTGISDDVTVHRCMWRRMSAVRTWITRSLLVATWTEMAIQSKINQPYWWWLQRAKAFGSNEAVATCIALLVSHHIQVWYICQQANWRQFCVRVMPNLNSVRHMHVAEVFLNTRNSHKDDRQAWGHAK